MATFETHKIEVLFSLCLAKARVVRDRADYVRLSEAINNSSPLQAPNITQKYLDESIDKGLKRAEIKSKRKLGLNKEYVTALAVYLGYESYRDYEDAYYKVQEILSCCTESKIRIFHSKESKGEAAAATAHAPYPDQVSDVEIYLCEVPDNLSLFEADRGVPLTLLWIDQTWINQQQPAINELATIGPGLFIASNDQGTVPQFSPITQQQFAIFFQVLTYKHTHERLPDMGKDIADKRPIIIKDSGAINLGTIGKIETEYFSSRDMTINIKKKK